MISIFSVAKIENFLRIVKAHPRLFAALLLFLVTFLAYGQTMRMYIWQDDHAIMFKLQHIEEGAGHFGTGIYDRGSAYRGVLVPLYLIYKVFGINPVVFYTAGIVAYFFASLAVYFFAKTLTKNKLVSFASAAIFAAGYVGAETLWRIFNSIHTLHTVIFLAITLAIYKIFIDERASPFSKRLLLYLVALALFIYTIETGYVRAHGIIFLIIGLELLFNFRAVASLVRLTPFTYMYYRFYIFANPAGYELTNLLENIFVKQRFELLVSPLKTLENIIIPAQWQFSVVIFVLLLLAVLFWSRSRLLLYSAIFMIANYLVYFIHTPTQVFPSTHRYLTLSLIGFSIFAAVLLEKIMGEVNKKYLTVAALLVVFHLALVNIEQTTFLQEKSFPAKKFYKSLKREIPVLPKGSSVFFDVRQDKKSTDEFGNFFWCRLYAGYDCDCSPVWN